MGEGDRVPKLAEDFDPTSLSMDPFEGFVLARIDGVMGLQEIADSTGATMDQVLAIIAKLEMEGAVEWVDPAVTRREQQRRSRRPLRDTPGRGLVRTRPAPPGASRLLYDPAELEEPDVDLDVDRRREILDTYYRLDELDHYQLLGVPRKAEKREIRDAYFRLSKLFHPDTLYGKRLGSYKGKMESVFKRLTDAYEVLGKKKKRAKYDDYLAADDRLKGIEREIEVGQELADTIEKEVRDAAESAIVMPSAPPLSEPPGPPPSKPPTPKPPPPTAPRLPAEERRRRARQLLERRLRSATTSSRPSAPSPAPESVKPPTASREDLLRGLASSLKHVAKVTGGVGRLERHLQDASDAESSGDLVGAVNALRLALALEPDNADVRGRYNDLHTRLTQELAETYQKQATYEEEQENWSAAARSWGKVSEGRPTRAEPARRAAEALLKAEGDLRKARDFAQKAVELQPRSVRNRLVLAQVFIAAQMTVSARGELEEAAKLDPKDEMVKNLLRQLK
ncbi:MAG: DnaJ domain-containing protein [Myxococcota bacterium]